MITLKRLIEVTTTPIFTENDLDGIIRRIDSTDSVQHRGASGGEWSFHLTISNADKNSYEFPGAGGRQDSELKADMKRLFLDISVKGNVARKSSKSGVHEPFSPVIFRWLDDGTFKLVYNEYPGPGGAPKFQPIKITTVEGVVQAIKKYMKGYFDKAVKDYKLM